MDDDESRKSLLYDDTFWTECLGSAKKKATFTEKVHLVFSLMIFLGITIASFLDFLFTSPIQAVRQRAGKFLQYPKRHGDLCTQFAPARVFKHWHNNYPSSRTQLHEIVENCAMEIGLEESDRIINDKSLKVRVQDLTMSKIRLILSPGKLGEKYQTLALFTTNYLRTFTASPNEYRRKKAAKRTQDNDSANGSDTESDFDMEPVDEVDLSQTFLAAEGNGMQNSEDSGNQFYQSVDVIITLVIAMLTFTCNRASNMLPLLLGLFFSINGTSYRVMHMLSNVGLSVSIRTIERLKEQLSNDAIEWAIILLATGLCYIIYDNINIYLRKWEQRLTNKNEMLHITNSAVIGVDEEGIDPEKAMDLDEKLKLRGERRHAKFDKDIKPNTDDQHHMQKAFAWLIANFLLHYCPGNHKWKERSKMVEEVRSMMPNDRPLPPRKTDVWPFGVFDVNEGSKKGQVKLNHAMMKRAKQSEESWVKGVAIRIGDWLTSNLIRLARRDRTDEPTRMERLDFIEEQSALWHFALQATHMIMRTHLGDNPANDPAALETHKKLLRRTWDPTKPNYAAAKSLIRHSLIGRLMHIVMVLKGFHQWSQLESVAKRRQREGKRERGESERP
ncbi:hypothetical protein VKT23_020504 [Stygiomarasmius scandens]|uniref:DUF6589 domain-containing protein n=1 Tax=Marasmiellus scandens TaxID=2682957 RepID=A0ABR1IIX9_9AGAR